MLISRPYDVTIAGCGPVGALAANLAAQAGLSVLVVEREAVPHPLPRAVHLDHEVMRLFQGVGLVESVLPVMRETEGHLHVGADHGVIRYMGTAGRPKPFGWANDYFFYQPELEERLRQALLRFPNVELRLGTDLVDMASDEDGVTLRCRRGDREEFVRTRWVIACDGARSHVRKSLGIGLEDLQFEEPWLVVDVEVDGAVTFPDLWGVPAGADLQKLSVMMCDPVRPATIVPGRGNVRRWEFMLLDGEDDASMMAPEAVDALLAPYLRGVDHRVLRASTYRFHGLVAERWRSGRVFLAGDAAHQTPPFFGQGMCHGMRDVSNLVWKLALVTRGLADPALLDSYQLERDPHVRHVINAAVEAGRYICERDPGRARARDAAMRERARSSQAATTAADLIPAYVSGVVAEGTPGAGERFVQPWVVRHGEPVLLDDMTGGGWRLFVADAGLAATARSGVSTLDPVAVRVIEAASIADGGSLMRWMQARAVRAVLVRPDFYVFGTTQGDVRGLLAHASRTLRLLRSPDVAA